MNDVNGLAILAAALAAWVAGAVYYMTLGKIWMAAMDKRREDLHRTGFWAIFPFINSFACELIMALVLALALGPLGLGHVSLRTGVVTGLVFWVGFILTTTATGYAYSGRNLKLFIIDTGHWLIVMVLMGAIIGLFG